MSIIEPVITTIHITAFPGLTGTYSVRKGTEHVGWVKQVAPVKQANAWEATNIDGDTTSYFGSAEEAAAYISNGGQS